MTGSERCCGCGKELPEGQLRYVVNIRAVADFDGVLPKISGDLEEEIASALAEAEQMDSCELEKDVHQEVTFFLCKRCKEEFMSDPLDTGEDLALRKGKASSLMH
jgi:hypothetical protein